MYGIRPVYIWALNAKLIAVARRVCEVCVKDDAGMSARNSLQAESAERNAPFSFLTPLRCIQN